MKKLHFFAFIWVCIALCPHPSSAYPIQVDIIAHLRQANLPQARVTQGRVILAASSSEIVKWGYYGTQVKIVKKGFCERVSDTISSFFYSHSPNCTKDIYDPNEWNRYPNGYFAFKEATSQLKTYVEEQIKIRATYLCKLAEFDRSISYVINRDFKQNIHAYIAPKVRPYEKELGTQKEVLTRSYFPLVEQNSQVVPHWKFESVVCSIENDQPDYGDRAMNFGWLAEQNGISQE